MAPRYTIVFFHVMNKKKWEALPKDVQTTIEQINKEWIEKQAKIWVDIDTEGKEFAARKATSLFLCPRRKTNAGPNSFSRSLTSTSRPLKKKGSLEKKL